MLCVLKKQGSQPISTPLVNERVWPGPRLIVLPSLGYMGAIGAQPITGTNPNAPFSLPSPQGRLLAWRPNSFTETGELQNWNTGGFDIGSNGSMIAILSCARWESGFGCVVGYGGSNWGLALDITQTVAIAKYVDSPTTASYSATVSSLPSLINNEMRAVGLTKRGDTIKVFTSGRTASTTGGNGGIRRSAGSGIDDGKASYSSSYGQLALAAVTSKVLSDQDMLRLTLTADAPWEMFKRRIWVPVSAGGGGASVIGAADGAATASTLAGSSQAQAALTAAAGAATASTLVGSAIAVSTTSAAAGASTAGALAGSSLAMSAIAAAAGVSSAQTLTATSTAVASITQAAGAGSAQSLVGASVALASITPAEGSSTASTLAAVGGDRAAITPADGTSTASSLAGSSTAVSGITTAAGAGTASTVAGASVAVAAITPAAGVSTAATMEPAAAAPSAITPAAGASTSATLAGLSVAVAAIVPADGASTTGTLADANAAPPPPAPAPSPSGGRPPYVEPNPAAEWLARLIADDAQILALLQEQVDAGVFN